MEQQASPWWQRELSEQQFRRLQVINDWTNKQQALVYTPAQQERVKAGRQEEQSPEQFWASLNLTPEQDARLRAIHRESQRQMKAVVMSDDL